MIVLFDKVTMLLRLNPEMWAAKLIQVTQLQKSGTI